MLKNSLGDTKIKVYLAFLSTLLSLSTYAATDGEAAAATRPVTPTRAPEAAIESSSLPDFKPGQFFSDGLNPVRINGRRVCDLPNGHSWEGTESIYFSGYEQGEADIIYGVLPNLSQLRTLNTHLQTPEQVAQIAGALPNLRNLRELVLCVSGTITSDELNALFAALPASLTTLQINQSPLNHEKLEGLMSQLTARCAELQELSLQGNGIGPESATTFGASLPKLKKLKNLYLSKNTLGDDGLSALVAAGGFPQSLKRLFLNGCALTDTSIPDLMRAFENPEMIIKHLEIDTLTETGSQTLFTMLRRKALTKR